MPPYKILFLMFYNEFRYDYILSNEIVKLFISEMVKENTFNNTIYNIFYLALNIKYNVYSHIQLQTYSENNSAYSEFSEEQIKYSNTTIHVLLDVYYCMKMVLCN